MEINIYNLNEWFTERCLMCDSVNHIFFDTFQAHGWECYCCNSKWWLDDLEKAAYMAVHRIDEATADSKLSEGEIKVFYGTYEPW